LGRLAMICFNEVNAGFGNKGDFSLNLGLESRVIFDSLCFFCVSPAKLFFDAARVFASCKSWYFIATNLKTPSVGLRDEDDLTSVCSRTSDNRRLKRSKTFDWVAEDTPIVRSGSFITSCAYLIVLSILLSVCNIAKLRDVRIEYPIVEIR